MKIGISDFGKMSATTKKIILDRANTLSRMVRYANRVDSYHDQNEMLIRSFINDNFPEIEDKDHAFMLFRRFAAKMRGKLMRKYSHVDLVLRGAPHLMWDGMDWAMRYIPI